MESSPFFLSAGEVVALDALGGVVKNRKEYTFAVRPTGKTAELNTKL